VGWATGMTHSTVFGLIAAFRFRFSEGAERLSVAALGIGHIFFFGLRFFVLAAHPTSGFEFCQTISVFPMRVV